MSVHGKIKNNRKINIFAFNQPYPCFDLAKHAHLGNPTNYHWGNQIAVSGSAKSSKESEITGDYLDHTVLQSKVDVAAFTPDPNIYNTVLICSAVRETLVAVVSSDI